MSWWNPISAVIETVGGWLEANEETKQVKAVARVDLAKANSALKIARVESDTKIEVARGDAASRLDDNVQTYDMQVLRNRLRGYVDDVIVYSLISLVVAHFVPYTQPFMRVGWEAMGYTQGPAWWLEFSIVVAIVSTLGGMRVLKEFFSGAINTVRNFTTK